MAAEVEALAWHRAVQFATEIGLQEAIFEGDAEVLIKMLQQNEFEFVPYGQRENFLGPVLYKNRLLVIRVCGVVAVFL